MTRTMSDCCFTRSANDPASAKLCYPLSASNVTRAKCAAVAKAAARSGSVMIAIMLNSLRRNFRSVGKIHAQVKRSARWGLAHYLNSGKDRFERVAPRRPSPAGALLSRRSPPGRDRANAPGCFAISGNSFASRVDPNRIAKLPDKVVLGELAVVKGRLIGELDNRDCRATAVFGFCVDGLDQRV
jgi:hypothetical protein